MTINIELPGKEYIMQKKNHYGHTIYRCVSWSPHYVCTLWVETEKEAVDRAEKNIAEYYAEAES